MFVQDPGRPEGTGLIFSGPYSNLQAPLALLAGGAAAIHRLDDDHAAAAPVMRAQGLIQGYERAPITGHWPSEEVLAPSLRPGLSCTSG